MPFKGISGLRSGEEVVKYEPWMIDEILKCSTDPIYFCKNYIYINSKDDGVIKFPIRDYQEDIVKAFAAEKMVCAKWPRQAGKSTCTVAFMLWFALFHSDKTIAILANKLDLAKEQLENLKNAYVMLPEWMQAGVESWAKTRITLSNGTKIICAATSVDGIRGMAINLLYLDEFAFVPGHIAEQFIASVFPTISSGMTTKLIITSTPNGMNHFFQLWDAAERKKNAFVPKQIAWNAVPGRTEQWARDRIGEIGEIRFNQEFKCEFIGSQSTLIDHTFLSKMIKETREPLIIPRLPEFCKIWQLPISAQELETRNWEYVASLDSGMGLHKDNTVLQICLVKSNIHAIQVAKMCSNKMDIEEFCEKSMSLLKAYHMPRLIIEQNGPGTAAVNFFHYKKEYENLIHFDPHGKRLGLISSNPLKRFAVIGFKAYIQKKLLKIYDHETVKELLSFGKKGQIQWEGLGGNHDDHVLSLIWIVYYLCSPLFYGNISEKDISSLPDDSSILLTEDVLNDELIAQSNLHNPHFHKEILENAAIYGTIGDEDNSERGDENGGNGDDNDGGGSAPGVFFRKGR